MKIRFTTFNHSQLGTRSLEDIIDIMGNQLRAIGHEVEWRSDYFATSDQGINFVLEGFEEESVREMARVHAEGCRFIIVATEEPTEKGYNWGAGGAVLMKKRQDMFPEAAKFCEGILHLVPGEHVTRWYAQYAPTAQAELGYSPQIMKLTAKQPYWDFGFYGSMSNRRLKILRHLARGSTTAVRIVGDFKTQNERDEAMQNCKVIVQIRKHDTMGLVSSSRCVTAMSLGRPIIAEPHQLSAPWDEVVRFSKTLDGFYQMAYVVKAAWRGVWEDQFAKFKAKLSPEFCVGEPLERIGFGRGASGLAA